MCFLAASATEVNAQTADPFYLPAIEITTEDDTFNIAIQFNEPFRWKNTSYKSLDKFPQPFFGLPDVPHEIWFQENKELHFRQTDIVFIGTYKNLSEYEIEANVNALGKIVGVFNEQTHLLTFDGLDYSPHFPVPKIILEKSDDLKNWTQINLDGKLPREYHWPAEVKLNFQFNEESQLSFFRVKLGEE